MTEQAQAEALEAIHQEAEKLVGLALSNRVAEGIQLIASIARYGFDVRTEEEKARE